MSAPFRRAAAFCAFACAILLLAAADARQASAAGFRTLSAGGLDIRVWYPSDGEESLQRLGPFDAQLALDAPLKQGEKFQFILLSHGVLGYARNYHTTAKALADAGFIVVAPLHAADAVMGDGLAAALHWRTLELRNALAAVLQLDEFRHAADLSRIHALGHSLGSITALSAAGAGTDLQLMFAHCASNDDPQFCNRRPFYQRWMANWRRGVTAPTPQDDIPLRYFHPPLVNGGVAVVAPLGQGPVFEQGIFAARQLFIVGFQDDEIAKPKWHAQRLREIFPADKVAHFSIRTGNHFAFIAQFADRVPEAEARPIMQGPPGFERQAFLRDINEELAAFFTAQMR